MASTWLIVATRELDATGPIGALQRGARSHFLSVFLDRTDRAAARALLPVVAEHGLTDRNLRPREATETRRPLDREATGEATPTPGNSPSSSAVRRARARLNPGPLSS